MFKGLGNLGNIASIVGKLKDVPERMQQLNDQMKAERVTATSSCGHVTVTMNGVGEVQSVVVDPNALNQSDDLSATAENMGGAIQEATNTAGADAKKMYADGVSKSLSDMDINIPGIDGLLSSFTGGQG